MAVTIKRPRVDDRPIFNIIFGLAGAQALFAAHELKLFDALADSPLNLDQICQTLQLHPRAARSLLSMCVSLDLIRLDPENRYTLTEISGDYLTRGGPAYWGGTLDAMLANKEIFSLDAFKNAVLENSSQAYKGSDVFKSNAEQIELAQTFTRSMHSKSMPMAMAWPDRLDLAQHRTMLDIGGGSGAHCIGALALWPAMDAIVFDRPFVCEVANTFIDEHGLQQRIQTHEGDMWEDPFPEADIHFYSDIFHDWLPDKCRFLARKSFASLPPGGKIILHEMLFNEKKTGPLFAAAYNINMMLWTEGQQFSGDELVALLQEAGFTDTKVLSTGFGEWSIVTGNKP
ncbi:MAG: methyltransferase [Desulfobulbus sp.]|jgi:cyclopropane fatty-acyl-phospholipid synthase-like methyltransferase|nr:MAG: methyltransferase [Desulfobulbus sp.]